MYFSPPSPRNGVELNRGRVLELSRLFPTDREFDPWGIASATCSSELTLTLLLCLLPCTRPCVGRNGLGGQFGCDPGPVLRFDMLRASKSDIELDDPDECDDDATWSVRVGWRCGWDEERASRCGRGRGCCG